jgi:SsrA-binding protein
MAKEKDVGYKVVAENRRGRYEYEILESFEAGIELFGTEVKSLRAARATIHESYAGPMNEQFYLFNADIPEYKFANQFNHERKRPRRLLLQRKQIHRLNGGVQREGLTVIALKLYFNERGLAKLQLALAKGKKLHDKRETEKQRDWAREKSRILKDHNK